MKQILQAKIAHNYNYDINQVEIMRFERNLPGIWLVVVKVFGNIHVVKVFTKDWSMVAIG